MRTTNARGLAWRVTGDGRHVAHVAGHVLTVRLLDASTVDVCIDGYSRRWPARGRDPLRDAEKALLAMAEALPGRVDGSRT